MSSANRGMPWVPIIRFSEEITFPSGRVSNMCTFNGTPEKIKEYAEKVAREHGVEVVAIV